MIEKDREKILKKMSALKSVSNVSVSPEVPYLFNNEIWVKGKANPQTFEKEYIENPVLNAVINLKASFESNMKIMLRNVKTNELVSVAQYRRDRTKDKIVNKMFNLILNPNPLQSTKEFFALNSIFKDVFGNAFIYANSANDKINIDNIQSLWNVWPQWMKPETTGKYFNQLDSRSIIKSWDWTWKNNKRNFSTEEILHRKEPNIRLRDDMDLVLGESKQASLNLPLSNIRIAYESRNSIAQNRGMLGIISSDRSDGNLGDLTMDDDEKQEVTDDLSDYGLQKGQKKWLVTRHNIKYQQVDQDVRKLGLLNEIASDAMIVAHDYGVNEILVKLYTRGATFENQRVAERSTYQNTVIPEAEDKFEDLNNFLKVRDKGWEYVVNYSHIPALQENEKDRSETLKNVGLVYKELFLAGGCSYNRWLQGLGEEPVKESWADKRVTQMTMEEIQKIKGNFSINNSLDKEDTQ